MTIASFEVVKKLPDEAFGLIFGLITFIALGLQTVLTSIVNAWLNISAPDQFIIYAGYYFTICLTYLPLLFCDLSSFLCKKSDIVSSID